MNRGRLAAMVLGALLTVAARAEDSPDAPGRPDGISRLQRQIAEQGAKLEALRAALDEQERVMAQLA